MEKEHIRFILTDNDHSQIKNTIEIFLEKNQCLTPSLKKPILKRSSNKGIWFHYILEKNKPFIIHQEFIYDENNNIVETKYNCIG